jgi:peptidoglycan-associated lipoprotein
MLKSLIVVAILCSSCALIAQPITKNTFEQKVKAAQEAEEQENYLGAFEWYEKAYDDIRKGSRGNPQVKEFAIKLADLNFILRDYEKSEKGYARVLKNDDDLVYVDLLYGYGMALKAQAKYDKAINAFNNLLTYSTNEELKNKARFELDGIAIVQGLEPNIETSFKPLDKEVNSASAEYSPRENPDGMLYYGSLDRRDIIEIEEEDDDYHAKIFLAKREDSGKFSDAEPLKQNVNRKDFHNTHLAFSEDGRTMYYTRVQTVGTEITSSKLMVSYKRDSGWSASEELPTVNGDWIAKQPAVGSLFGRTVLYFVSDMDGGIGGMDIYYSNILGDGQFSAPVNLGDKINTKKDELTPFYFNGTLYFSSDGFPTIGGYDIFYSLWDGTEWSTPENMGMGYNSSYDDLYPSFVPEGNRGYIVSNRPTEKKKKLKSESCCDDIFEFSIREIVIDLLAIVTNENNEPLEGATIKLENITDPYNYPTDMKYNALGNEFQFLLDSDFSYKAVITREGYFPDSIDFNTAGILDNYTVNKTITLKPKPVEVEEPDPSETAIVEKNETFRLNNIYYDFDDDKILKDSEPDLMLLKDLMDQYPSMVIELSSHTDSQGRDSYNKELSQRRAESAKKWLVKKGINPNRIKPVGYGETQILNRCVNRVKCTDDEHRFNRRTEFKMIEGPDTITIKRSNYSGE